MSRLTNLLRKTDAGSNNLSSLCLDPRKPVEMRAKILLAAIHSSGEPAVQQALLTDLLQHTGPSVPETEAAQLKEYYEQALAELENGAVRPATFLAVVEENLPGPKPRIHVVTPDGQERYPALHEGVSLAGLQTGMTVYLDPKGAVVLGTTAGIPPVGQEGTFLRLVEGTRLVEASLQNDRVVLYASASVLEAIAAGQLRAGDRLLVCPRRHVAFRAVPAPTDYRHRFLDRSQLPDVVAERDIGKPHWILKYLINRLRVLLHRPDLLERFDLRPRCAVILTGPSGCGKTLTIRAFLGEFVRMLVERTGRTDLGSRVIRVKVAELFSEYLGRSDKNIEELFDDIRSIAAAEVATGKGERLRLPVVVVLEEVEGIARRRGGQESAIYDRILATLLQRLDDPTDDLGRLPLFLISTSNRPDLIDSAMARRLGVQARFTRLDREGFTAVLDKKLKPIYPYRQGAGQTEEEARSTIMAQVAGWLFDPDGDGRGLVEITLRGGKRLVKRRRDFLTGGLVEQAVAGAIDQAVSSCLAATGGSPHPDPPPQGGREAVGALTAPALIDAFRRLIDSLAENLTPHNAADYLDLPENAQVAGVRRIPEIKGYLPPLLSDLDN